MPRLTPMTLKPEFRLCRPHAANAPDITYATPWLLDIVTDALAAGEDDRQAARRFLLLGCNIAVAGLAMQALRRLRSHLMPGGRAVIHA